jgi:serine/threonine protein kinase
MIGTVLGHYRIVRLLGKGGMGEVYAGEDLTLGRTVAIKVLPAGIQAQPEDRERFEREAKAVAALNHRSIVTLHSFEEAGGVRFITMELVEGEPLTARVRPGGLPLDTLLQIGVEISDAVGAAHEKGIVHRDLKPANVLVTADGHLKVLDFGLAKLRAPEEVAAELPTQHVTGDGHIVGTVAYMSPEQAEAKPVDQRTDIFSLGTMLYELATGQRPFQGDTSMSVLSAVLKDTPRPAIELNPSLPPAFARVLRTCLQKDPDRRYQSAKDLRNELRTIKEELDSGELARPVAPPPPPTAAPRAALFRRLVVSAAVVGLGVGAWGVWSILSRPSSSRISLLHTKLTAAPGTERDPTLSPDAKWVLYVAGTDGNPDIYLQSVTGQTAINLTRDSPAADIQPAFSPDGERIAFRSSRDGGGIYVMGRTGEAPRRVAAEGFDPAWSPDGTRLVYATLTALVPTSRAGLSALRIVDVENGTVTPLVDGDALNPAWSPNGRFIAYWGMTGGTVRVSGARDLWVIPAAGGTPWRLVEDSHVDWCPLWSADGRHLYFASNRGGSMNLWRMPMNPDTGKAAGEPEAMTTPARYVARPRMSATGGHVVYESREATSNVHRSALDLDRAVLGPSTAITSGSRIFSFVDPSPSGESLVLGTGYLQQEDLFISGVDGANLRQLTNDLANDRYPEWSPDGSTIAFYSDRTGKYEIWTSTSSGQLTQLTNASDFSTIYPHWSPTGDRMTFSDVGRGRVVATFDPRKPWPDQKPDVLPPPAGPGSYLEGVGVRWSPDGKELAGSVNGIVTIYNIASRTYRRVPGDVRGVVNAWLRDGRLLVGPATPLRLVDPKTGQSRPVSTPPLPATVNLRLSRDERTGYFILTKSETDIWLVTIAGR